MARGYVEGSKMSRTLDALVRKGIDCIKVIPSKYIANETVFLALGVGEGDYSYEGLCKICDSIKTGNMEIIPSRMYGKDIKLERELKGLEPNPGYRGVILKIEDNRNYNVLKVRYIFAEIGTKTSQKYDMSYLGPKFKI